MSHGIIEIFVKETESCIPEQSDEKNLFIPDLPLPTPRDTIPDTFKAPFISY